ncbi:starch-binding protein [Reichenbachiella sp.]|uniref:starch-binding protein n=1 Tax=Reichenbachiella sp. TaxID=2184521 RepID=UPI00329A5E62
MKTIYLTACLMASIYLLPMAAHAQQDFREESIYFLLTTRFFDGDPSNNVPNEWSSYHPDPNVNPNITDPNDVTWRGDFKGLIQKLDYIQDLGFTAIWITPIVQNWSPLDYHGYHAYDFTKVDPRLESPGATFQDLIDAVHARGMKIVLDIVTNHSGRFGVKGLAEIKYNTDPSQPWGQDSNGNPLQPNPDWEYDGLTPNPDDGKIWSRANLPNLPPPYSNDLSAYNWPSTQSYVDNTSIDWYHHSGNGFAQGWDDTENLYNRALAGDTPDFNTGSQVLRDYLVAAYTTFINMGVDAFRWDTMKHMSKEDVLYFKDAFHAVNPDLFIFGEVAQLRHELHNVEEINPHWYTWRGEVNNSEDSEIAILDFYAEATFHNIFEEGQGFSGVTAAARYDHLYADPSTNLLWLDNHDFGPNNDWNRRYGGSEENLAACMNFMFTWRGIPVVYYGTEIQFMKGEYADIHDASGIEKSINLTGRAYYGDQFADAPNHTLYQHLKKLNAMRREIPALQKGSWRWDGNHGGNAIGYVRKHNDSEVAVGLSKDGGSNFTFNGMTNGIYRDAVTGAEISVNNGSISFFVESGSAGLYVLNGPGMIGGNGSGFFQPGVGGGNPVVTISPDAGVYSNPVSVALSASSQNDPTTIYFTTDGSNPNTGSTSYADPITISTSSTLKALAVDAQGNHSNIVSAAYTIGDVGGFSVYYKQTSGANSANIHHWNSQPAGSLAESSWPGPFMVAEGDDWYRFDFVGVASSNLLFNDNGGSKTADLFRDKDGWFENGSWSDTDPRITVNQPPALSMSPGGGSFIIGDVVSVEVIASDDTDPNPAIYYTLDGSMPSAGSAVYSDPITISHDATLKVIAIDNQNAASEIQTGVFNFNPAPSGLTVHFKPEGYSNPSMYYWNVTPSGQTIGWPGITMTDEGDGWYAHTLLGADCSNIIFSNNGSSQTADLNRCGEGWYEGGIWYDEKPQPSAGLTIHFKKPTSWNGANMHYWNVTPSGAGSSNWPGPAMTNDGGGWYSYTLPEATCANLVFNDSGSSQTADLYRCGEGWYDNDWSNASSRNLRKEDVLNPISEDGSHTAWSVYPNPSNGADVKVQFYLKQRESVSFKLIDLSGMIVDQYKLGIPAEGHHQFSIDTEKINTGIYILQWSNENLMLRKRIIINKR